MPGSYQTPDERAAAFERAQVEAATLADQIVNTLYDRLTRQPTDASLELTTYTRTERKNWRGKVIGVDQAPATEVLEGWIVCSLSDSTTAVLFGPNRTWMKGTRVGYTNTYRNGTLLSTDLAQMLLSTKWESGDRILDRAQALGMTRVKDDQIWPDRRQFGA